MKPFRILPLLLSLLLLGGCTFPSGDDLLAAPRPSTNYQSLQTELDHLLASGVSYTTPSEGENRSSVQLTDLDGDGVDEAIAFFRGSTSATSNTFQVYVYRKQDDQYVCTGSVEGQATAIESVDYPVITPAGGRGMVITWRLTGDGTGALTMCDFDQDCAPGVLLETEYSAMELTDLTGDGARDLLLLTTDPGGKRVARLYQYQDGTLLLAGEAATSPETASVERMRSGRLADGNAAVLAEERMASGVGLTTDIFVYTDGTLSNLALGSEARSTYRPITVYATDINGDGAIELPRAVLMAGYTDAAASNAMFLLDWYAFSASETPAAVATTYENIADGWRITIDPAWRSRITAEKTTDNGMSVTVFYEYRGDGSRTALFSIYTATGTAREYYAGRGDLIQLGESSQAVYFAKIPAEAQNSALQIPAKDIKAHFAVITQDWNN